MYVKVRTMDGKDEVILMISKLAKVKDLKLLIEKELKVKPAEQKLFYGGKQLENDYKMYDYNINLNNVIQLMVSTKVESGATSSNSKDTKRDKIRKSHADKEPIEERSEISQNSEEEEEEELIETECLYYKIGDAVDCLDQTYGAWFEAIIKKIYKKEDKLLYSVQWEFGDKVFPFNVFESHIRPRARRIIPISDLSIGEKVMINYNIDIPQEVGLWYDFTIRGIEKKRKQSNLIGILHVALDQEIKDQKIQAKWEIFAIETSKLLTERTAEDNEAMTSNGKRRRVAAACDSCMDDPEKECHECGCRACAGKQDEHSLLLCDECNDAYHLGCLDPPLAEIPEEDYWYCPKCKNDENEIVKAGDKKSKAQSQKTHRGSDKKRDWGSGMGCVGKSKDCSIVPPNHRGPIPGVEVGMCWLYRVQLSEMGVHRPHVAGIHGRETECAYSIVLSGGYEDDVDNGNEFMYTGSGGRDLSGNKRTAEQSCDQKLTRMNKALALNCNAKLNDKVGATAANWKEGIPVRVVRNFKLQKYSKYAPKEGNRYDGIYKVVKYYPDTGKKGFRVWRYLLRRDDPSPAPWTKEGRERIALLDLKISYPEGYLEAMKKKQEQGLKRPASKDTSSKTDNEGPLKKRFKKSIYKLEDELRNLIKEDNLNAKLWEECTAALVDGRTLFLQRVSERFTCVCCIEIVCNPVTTPCAHNICHGCLKRSFSSGVYSCPSCRHKMDKNYNMEVNSQLSSALLQLFPGYNVGR